MQVGDAFHRHTPYCCCSACKWVTHSTDTLPTANRARPALVLAHVRQCRGARCATMLARSGQEAFRCRIVVCPKFVNFQYAKTNCAPRNGCADGSVHWKFAIHCSFTGKSNSIENPVVDFCRFGKEVPYVRHPAQ